MKASRRVLAVAIALGLVFVQVPSAIAEGWVGYHYTQVQCYRAVNSPHQAIVSPTLNSSPVGSQGGTFSVGGGHSQWVAFRVHIYRSTDNVDFFWDYSDSWLAAVVGDGVNSLDPVNWWNFDTQQWESRGRTFNLNASGFYRAAVEYYWYQDDQVSFGYSFAWANDHYDSTGDGFFNVSRTACQV